MFDFNITSLLYLMSSQTENAIHVPLSACVSHGKIISGTLPPTSISILSNPWLLFQLHLTEM